MLLKLSPWKQFEKNAKAYLACHSNCLFGDNLSEMLKNIEYDQEIPQSQTADKPMAPLVRVTQPSRDTRKTN